MAAQPPTPAPLAQAPIARLASAATEHNRAAEQNRRRTTTFAVFTAALGPLAVLLLTVQALAFPHGGPIGVALILGELALLTGALALAFLRIGHPSHAAWIDERLRAELLKREKFLLEARVGPYLRQDLPDMQLFESRLAQLRAREAGPEEFLELEDARGTWWDQLEDVAQGKASGASAGVDALPKRVKAYLADRVLEQKSWFSQRAEKHAASARRWENGAKLVLVLAATVAGVHLGLLLAGPAHGADPLHIGVVSLAIVLPSVGAALVGLLSIRGSHRLGRAYRYNARVLQRIEDDLRRLQGDLERKGDDEEWLTYRFKRLVLRTEELLSDDFRQWWIMTKPEPPRPGA